MLYSEVFKASRPTRPHLPVCEVNLGYPILYRTGFTLLKDSRKLGERLWTVVPRAFAALRPVPNSFDVRPQWCRLPKSAVVTRQQCRLRAVCRFAPLGTLQPSY
jgi:hypothetical protein